MKCHMGHFGEPLNEEIVAELEKDSTGPSTTITTTDVDMRRTDAAPALVKAPESMSYYDIDNTEFYSDDELADDSSESKQLEAEAATMMVQKTDVATAAADAQAAANPKPVNKTMVFGSLAAIGALWFFNRD